MTVIGIISGSVAAEESHWTTNEDCNFLISNSTDFAANPFAETSTIVSDWDHLRIAIANGATNIIFGDDFQLTGYDATDTTNIENGQHVVIDAAGHTLTGTDDAEGWSPIIVHNGTLSIKNLGDLQGITPGSKISTVVIKSGWSDFGNPLNIYGMNEGEKAFFNVENSIFVSNGDNSYTMASIQINGNADVNIHSSIFAANGNTFGGTSVFADGGDLKTLKLNIDSCTFYQNSINADSTQGQGAAIWAQDTDEVVISNSYFQENTAKASDNKRIGGAVYLYSVNQSAIVNTVFDSNESDFYGGALVTYKGAQDGESAVYVVQDSSFIGNKSGSIAAGWMIFGKSEIENFLVAKNKDVEFSGNELVALSEEDDPRGSGEDIRLNYVETSLIINAYEGRTVSFGGTVSGSEDTDAGVRSQLFINKNEGLKTYGDGTIADSSGDAGAGLGTVVFNDEVEFVDLHLCGGTLKLLAKNTQEGSLGTSHLIVDGDALVSAVGDDKASSIKLAGLALNASAKVSLDADLANAAADNFVLNDGVMASGTGTLTIDSWNIVSDASQKTVEVSVAEGALKDRFVLGENAAKAQGKIYNYDVERTENGNYLFSSEGAAPGDYNPELYAGSVAAGGVAVATHLVSSAVFDRVDAAGSGLWATAAGLDDEMHPGNFEEVDYQYAAGILGYTSEATATAAGMLTTTAYAGFIYGNHDYSASDVEQNGAVAGGAVKLHNGMMAVSLQAYAGFMDTSFSESFFDENFDTPFAGVSARLSLEKTIGAVTVVPDITASYVWAKGDDFVTSAQAHVDSEDLSSFEAGPGITLKAKLNDNWTGFMKGRYNFTRTNGDTTADGVTVSEIDFDNYAEYGLGAMASANDWNFYMSCERLNDGQQGWKAIARLEHLF